MSDKAESYTTITETERLSTGERALALSALEKALAALNPLSGFLRKRTPKMERYLGSVRDEIRHAVQTLEINRG